MIRLTSLLAAVSLATGFLWAHAVSAQEAQEPAASAATPGAESAPKTDSPAPDDAQPSGEKSPTDSTDADSSDAEEPGSNLSFSAGVDVASSYYFRGFAQQTKGVATQPYMNMGLALWKATDKMPVGMSLNAGIWNSLDSTTPTNPWYEIDFTAGATFDLPAGLEFGASYVYYYNPNGGDIFAEEVDLQLSFNEVEAFGLEDMPLGLSFNPYALVAFELDGGSDGLGAGGEKGTYLELGLNPSITVAASKDYPVTLSVPLTLGLSPNDYYENSLGANDTFGFFDVAFAASVPLAFIPARYGSWTLTGAVHVNFLGQAAQDIANVDFGVATNDVNAWVGFGLAVE